MKKTRVNKKNKSQRKSIKRKQKGGVRPTRFKEALEKFLIGPSIPTDRNINEIHDYVLDKYNQYDQVLNSLYISKEEQEEEIIDGFIELKIVMLTPGSEGLSAADIQNNRVPGRKQQIIDLGNEVGAYLRNEKKINTIYLGDEDILSL
tara:strand:- start:409 stop:852 length:444 start_codon:yes stop_codon:yes gene_type:complete